MKEHTPIKSNKSKVDVIFVLTLFVLFAISLLAATVCFAKIYKQTGERTAERFNSATAITALVQKLRAYDSENGIEVLNDRDVGCVLKLNESIGGAEYSTYIYCLDGSLHELLAPAEGDFKPQNGFEIIPAEAFNIEQSADGSLKLTVVTEEQTITRSVYPRASGAKGAADE